VEHVDDEATLAEEEAKIDGMSPLLVADSADCVQPEERDLMWLFLRVDAEIASELRALQEEGEMSIEELRRCGLQSRRLR